MRGDLVGDHAVAYVFGIGQAEVFLWSDVAQHVGAVPADHCRPDRARYVIVAGRDVRNQRPQRVEWRAVADLLLFAHVHLDLLHRDVPRPLDHHLYIVRPRPLRQLA